MTTEAEGRSHCMRLDIRNFLRNQGNRPILGFWHDDGSAATDAEVRAELQGALTAGHKFHPMCDHDNFDHEKGWCRGPKERETL